jgi:membrane protease YdiL (CAAX protease family)
MSPTLSGILTHLRLMVAWCAVIGAEWLAERSNPLLVRLWEDLITVMGGHAPTALGPLIGSLGMALILVVAFVLLVHVGLFDDPDKSDLTIGIVGRDMPFLLAGLLFIALYASLADATLRAVGLPPAPAVREGGVLLGTLLVVPIVQEMLLRGGLMPTLARRLGASAAIILTAVPPLVVAIPSPTIIALSVGPQLLFGWTAWTCRSLGAAVILHVAFVTVRLALAG